MEREKKAEKEGKIYPSYAICRKEKKLKKKKDIGEMQG